MVIISGVENSRKNKNIKNCPCNKNCYYINTSLVISSMMGNVRILKTGLGGNKFREGGEGRAEIYPP
jgi:hypothetical protein